MRIRTNLAVITGLLATFIFASASTMPNVEEKPDFKNLKVLPKNISNEELRSVMKSWNAALGVKCNFCHTSQKDDPKKLDYASDAKPEKDITRSMYKMTMKINKKYFGHDVDKGSAVLEVSCNTCHRGKEHPEK